MKNTIRRSIHFFALRFASPRPVRPDARCVRGLLLALAVSFAVSSQAATVEYWDFENSTATGGAPTDGLPFADNARDGGNGLEGTLGVNGTLGRGWNENDGPQFDSDLVNPNGGSFAMDTVDASGDMYVVEGALHNWTSSDWTLQLHVYIDAIDGWETIVGRDGTSWGTPESEFYLQRKGIDNNELRLNYRDVDGTQQLLDGTQTLQTGQWYGFAVVADSTAGTITMYIDSGAGYVQEAQTTGLTEDLGITSSGLGWTFARGWYDGGFVDFMDAHIDNIRWSDTALARSALLPVQQTNFAVRVVSVDPEDQATGVYAQPVIEAVIIDGDSQVDTSSIVFTFDGATVTPSITGTGTTTVSYAVGSLLPAGSVHTAQVVVAGMNPTSDPITYEWTFTVDNYVTAPTSWSYPTNLISGGTRGFYYRDVMHDDGTTSPMLETTLARATGQLAFKLPFPDSSEEEPTPVDFSAYDYFRMPEDDFDGKSVINMNNDAGTGGLEQGNFFNTAASPQLPPLGDLEGFFPGIFFGFFDFADEIVAFLELDTGYHQLGVNSDDGFAFYMGEQPLDLFAPTLGEVDGPRSSANDSLLGIHVTQPGLYPFRLVHVQGSAAASLEFFTVEQDGTKVLVNYDSGGYTGVPAWRLTSPGLPPFVEWVEPQQGIVNLGRNHRVDVEIQDGETGLSSYQLYLEGALVATDSNKVGEVTTVTYTNGLPFETTNTFAIVRSDGVGTWSNDFEVITGPASGAIEVISVSPEGLGVANPVDFEVVLADGVSQVEVGTLELYLDGGLVAHSASTVNGTTTVSTVSSTNLPSGVHTGRIVYSGLDPAVGPFTNDWTWAMQPPPATVAVSQWNVNIAGLSGDTPMPVTDGVVVVAPDTGANLWNNLAATESSGPAGPAVTNSFVVTDVDGGNGIGMETRGTHSWGDSVHPDFDLPDMFVGWTGGNAPMNVDIELNGLDPAAEYDLYVYSTWRWTQNPVEYTLIEGTCDLTNATVTQVQANVADAAPTDYSGAVEGENYAVFVNVTPSAEGRMTFNGQSIDGVLSGLQLVQATTGGCVAPQVIVDPEPTTAVGGAPASFSVVAGGNSVAYQWRQDSVAISGATNATYDIAAASPSDAGLYDCVVSNACGSDTSAAARLTVYDALPGAGAGRRVFNINFAGQQSSNASVPDGTDLYAGSACGNQWNNLIAPPGVGDNWDPASPLPIVDACGEYGIQLDWTGITEDHNANAGANVPQALNQGYFGFADFDTTLDITGLDTNELYDIYVYFTWQWNETAVTNTITEGTGATTNLVLTPEWDSAVSYASYVEGSNYVVFTSIAPSAAGSIDINAQSADGGFSALQIVQVDGGVCTPPAVVGDPDDLVVLGGDPAAFSVVAVGSGPLFYQWRKDGGDLTGETNTTYTIAAVGISDEALYDCVVSNDCGTATSAAALLTYRTPPAGTAVELWNVNVAGIVAGTLRPVSDGSVVVAPSTGSNQWNNVAGDNNVLNTFVVTDANGANQIGLQTSGDHGWGEATNNNMFVELFQGWTGTAGMDVDIELSALDTNATYDLYLYSTWSWTDLSVTYAITEGTSSVYTQTVSMVRANVQGDASTDYGNVVEGENYVLFTEITPSAAGVIAVNGTSADGPFSGLQLVERGVAPVEGPPIGSATLVGTDLILVWNESGGSGPFLVEGADALEPDSATVWTNTGLMPTVNTNGDMEVIIPLAPDSEHYYRLGD